MVAVVDGGQWKVREKQRTDPSIHAIPGGKLSTPLSGTCGEATDPFLEARAAVETALGLEPAKIALERPPPTVRDEFGLPRGQTTEPGSGSFQGKKALRA